MGNVKRNRVLILGFDGLEYNLVEKLDLKHIKQVEYGKVDIPTECYKKSLEVPYTPVVWASFLTGELPSRHGITELNRKRWENSKLEWLRENVYVKTGLYKLLKERVPLYKLFMALGFKKRPSLRDDYRVPTIFDQRDGVTIYVPTIDPEWDIRLPYKKEIESTLHKLKELEWNRFREIRERTLNSISYKWEILMSYNRLADIWGHIAFGDSDAMQKIYRALNSFVGEVKDRVDKSIFILVVSDHGMEALEGTKYGGKHSDHAFYSSNIPLKLENPNIIDFYSIITRILDS